MQLSLIYIICTWLCFYPTDLFQDSDWYVPESAKGRTNPTDSLDKEDLLIGKSLYMQHCKSCHGKTGLGDGPQSKEIEIPVADFSSREFQSQSDGSLFYKVTSGRGIMPAFNKKIPEEDRWLVVNFLRTLSEQ